MFIFVRNTSIFMNNSPILFHNTLFELNQYLNKTSPDKIFILVDSNTHKHCLPRLLSEMETNSEIEIIEVPQGENNKVIEIVVQVWETLSDLGATRNSLLINLGGGVITDMGGFIASTFMRGIKFINIPTTLLSQVDASVGGKNGINLNHIKNTIGTFTQPEMTLINSDFLLTLQDREFRSGLAEMFKHGLIHDKKHWQKLTTLKEFKSELTLDMIEDSIHIKAEIVTQDPYEQGLRKILNFGHTVGHAIEGFYLGTPKELLHGEAIAVGMMIESILSFENEFISILDLNEIFFHLTRVFGKISIPADDIQSILDLMKHDKKNENGNINFSLINGIGQCKYNIVLPEVQIAAAIETYNRKLTNTAVF